MRVYVQHKPGCLIVALEGVANSIQDSLDADSALFRLIDARIRRHRPRCLMIDFRDLTLIDGSTLRSLLAHARGLASTLKVKLIGPGRALRRLQALLVHAPPVRFFPTIRAARKTFASSIEPRSGAWQPFFRQFVGARAEHVSVQDCRRRLGSTFIVDLEEEAAYLRSEGETPWNQSQPLVLEFRQDGRSPVLHGSGPARSENRIFESG